MGIYVKEKTNTSNLPAIDDYDYDGSFKVGISPGSEGLVVDYLTNLYSNKPKSIVRELFANASDASVDCPEAPVNIDIEEIGDTDTYSFRITDYGCGMSEEELIKNYINYASSTKIDDYNTIGSFGLGSKSPLSLVSSYTVHSNNGFEENLAIVSRTDKGIFGKIERITEPKAYSFTSVYFDGLSKHDAKAMSNYIGANIAIFSKHPIHFKTCFPRSNYMYDSIVLNNDADYPVTLYYLSGRLRECIMRYFEGGKYPNRKYVRINNTAYKLDDGGKIYDSSCHIVIDIEPGMLSFSPSRENLPEGEAISHIMDLANENYFDDDIYKFFDYVTKNGIYTPEEMFRYALMNKSSNKINDMRGFEGCEQYLHGVSEDNAKKYASMWRTISAIDVNDIKDDNKNIQVVYYNLSRKDNNSNKFYPIASEKANNFIEIIRAANANIKHISDIDFAHGSLDMSIDGTGYMNFNSVPMFRTTIVVNSKISKAGNVSLPKELRISTERDSMKAFMHSGYRSGINNLYDVYLFVKKIDDIPEKIKDILPYASVLYDKRKGNIDTCFFKVVEPAIVDYNDYESVSESSDTKNKRIDLDDRVVEYFVDNEDIKRSFKCNERQFKKDMADVGDVRYYTYSHSVDDLDELLQCSSVHIMRIEKDKTLGVKNFLDEMGLKQLDLTLNEKNYDRKITVDDLIDPDVIKEILSVIKKSVDKAVYNAIDMRADNGSCHIYLPAASVMQNMKRYQKEGLADYTHYFATLARKYMYFDEDCEFDPIKYLKPGHLPVENIPDVMKANKSIYSAQLGFIFDTMIEEDEIIQDVLFNEMDVNRIYKDYKEDLRKYFIKKIVYSNTDVYFAARLVDPPDKFYEVVGNNKNLFISDFNNRLDKIKESEECVAVIEALQEAKELGKYVQIMNVLKNDNPLDMYVKSYVDNTLSEIRLLIDKIQL